MSILPSHGAQSSAVAAFALAIFATASPASAEFIPSLDATTTAQREFLATSFARLTDTQPDNDSAALAALDKQLAGLPEPGTVRGMVQMLRAMALHRTDRAAAVTAIEESVALLPDYSGPLLVGSSIYAYEDQPAKAADYVLRASWIDPEIVARMDEYELFNLLHRLSARGERVRLADLSERLLELGWVGERVGSRATLAGHAIGVRVEAGNLQGAKALIPALVAPGPARKLLLDRRYERIWPDIERWAGSRLEKIWPLYLRQARSRWRARRDSSAARDYFAALELANHDSTIIWEILPLLTGEIDAEKDHDLVFLVAPIARVLARNGRWDDVRILFERANEAWPLGSNANALNVAANHARYLRYGGETAEGLALIDRVLADAAKRGGEVNQDALVGMHKERACMLHGLGRDADAVSSAEFVTRLATPTELADLHLCFGRHDAAVDALLAGLEQPQWRDSVLSFIQAPDSLPAASDVGRQDRERADRARNDPRLIEMALRYGRVLPWAPGDGAPPENAAKEPPPPVTSI